MRPIAAAGLLAMLLAGASIAPFAGVPGADASLPALTVTARCYSNPERTTIHNNRRYAITIRTVGSIYRPYSNEPFYVYRKLSPGRTVTFYTGYGASYSNPNTLNRRFIYSNSVGTREGARVVTTRGSVFVDRC